MPPPAGGRWRVTPEGGPCHISPLFPFLYNPIPKERYHNERRTRRRHPRWRMGAPVAPVARIKSAERVRRHGRESRRSRGVRRRRDRPGEGQPQHRTRPNSSATSPNRRSTTRSTRDTRRSMVSRRSCRPPRTGTATCMVSNWTGVPSCSPWKARSTGSPVRDSDRPAVARQAFANPCSIRRTVHLRRARARRSAAAAPTELRLAADLGASHRVHRLSPADAGSPTNSGAPAPRRSRRRSRLCRHQPPGPSTRHATSASATSVACSASARPTCLLKWIHCRRCTRWPGGGPGSSPETGTWSHGSSNTIIRWVRWSPA